MSISFRRVAVLGLASLAFAAAGCGEDEEEPAAGGGAAAESTATEAEKPAIKVGLVTDIGGLNDRSFNTLANKGLEDAKKQLGVEGRVITSKANSDYVPNLSSLAQQKYDLVLGVGFLMADAMDTVAKRFPDTNFAIVDFSAPGLKSKPKNVRGLLFKEAEAGYLAGYLAGKVAEKEGFDTVSSVGGQKIPPVDAYIAGYQAGAEAAMPGIKTLNGYSQDFVDQAKCKELGLSQIQRGSGVVFQVAGQCGLGALDAAKEQDKLGIGVDADQSFLGEHILTSAQKKVDVSVFETIKAVQDGAFQGGEDQIFDVKSEGVALGKMNAAGMEFEADVQKVQEQIAAGEIEIPTTVEG